MKKREEKPYRTRIVTKRFRMATFSDSDPRTDRKAISIKRTTVRSFSPRPVRWSSRLSESQSPLVSASDRSSSAETDRSVELRTRDRARKLILKIDEAMLRIEQGVYGYCVETDDPIGVKRLQARPIATLSLEAQERHERLEKTQRDD